MSVRRNCHGCKSSVVEESYAKPSDEAQTSEKQRKLMPSHGARHGKAKAKKIRLSEWMRPSGEKSKGKL